MIAKYGVRRWTESRDDRRCFELYEIATGKCASFPVFKAEGLKAAKIRNSEYDKIRRCPLFSSAEQDNGNRELCETCGQYHGRKP